MKTKGIRLTKDVLDAALAGGTILGGGGGGDPKKGRKYAEIAVDYTDLRLITIDDLDEDDVLLTASLVGAPNAANQYMTPKDIAKTVEISSEKTVIFILAASSQMSRVEKLL